MNSTSINENKSKLGIAVAEKILEKIGTQRTLNLRKNSPWYMTEFSIY